MIGGQVRTRRAAAAASPLVASLVAWPVLEARPASFTDVEVRCTVGGAASAHRLGWALTVVPAESCPPEQGT